MLNLALAKRFQSATTSASSSSSSSCCFNLIKRNFLTDNYYCYDQWDKFLLSETMQKAGTVNTFSIDIDSKLQEQKLVTPLDMELLAAKLVHISNHQELEFIERTFINFRKTQAALYVKESMSYSFVRGYIDLNQSANLLQILKLKYKYGIFLDQFTANMLMDVFVKAADSKSAALTAQEVMLQEISNNELTLAACLFSSMKYLKDQRDLGVENLSLVQLNQEEAQQKVEDENEDEDEGEKRLVYFMRKDYNDGHFDLDKMSELTGKTIHFAAKNSASNLPAELSTNLQIFGLLLMNKHNEAIDLLKQKQQGPECQSIYEFVLKQFDQTAKLIELDESKGSEMADFLTKWNAFREIYASKLGEASDLDACVEKLGDHLKQNVNEKSEKDISTQKELFTNWTSQQAGELDEQIKKFAYEVKKTSILRQLDDLERQEELLTFFDKRQDILDAYYNKGFHSEYPSQIPIEPEESIFAAKAERHFKPWPKYANKPEWYNRVSKGKTDRVESLKKIYLSNNKTTTA